MLLRKIYPTKIISGWVIREYSHILKIIFTYLLKLSDTEKGINGLQRQLESRDQELADERSKRQVLERHFEKKTQHRLINDLAKQRSRVQMGAYF